MIIKQKTFRMKALTAAFALAGALIAVIAFAAPHHHANASSSLFGGSVSGYAWSSTIGWVSMSGTGPAYGVTVSTSSGAFSGYAWSSNVGWISFNAADVASCGSVATANASTGVVTGWARVISGSYASGADGCISMSGTSPAYGVVISPTTGMFSGFAWGGVNVGWLNFNQVSVPTSTLTSTPTQLYVDGASTLSLPYVGGGAMLTWTTSATAACATGRTIPSGFTAPADWTGSVMPSEGAAGQEVVLPSNMSASPAVYTYSITCPDGTSAPTSTVTVTVAPADTLVPSISLTVDGLSSETVPSGTSVNLAWTSQNLGSGSCAASSAPDYPAWDDTTIDTSSTSVPVGGSYTTGPLTEDEAFTISGCSPVGGGPLLSPQTVDVTVTTSTSTSTTGGTATGTRLAPWQEF